MSVKKCFFIGHRDAPDTLYPKLIEEVRRHITEFGVVNFIVGRYGSFDKLAAKAVIELKKEYAEVTLTLLIPFHPAENRCERPHGFDDTIYPEGMETVPHRLAIIRANRSIIDAAEYLIAYSWQPGSNSLHLLEYAAKKHKHVSNLCSLHPTMQ